MYDFQINNVRLKDIQNKMVKILVEIDRICRSNNIQYSLEGGTLLGAIKYGGFIPWDDDIDIIMLRNDYEKFLKVCEMQLQNEFYLQNNRTKKEFPLNYTKICMNGTIYMQKDYENINMHHGLFVDIFPIDNVKPNYFRIHCSIIGALNGARLHKLKLKGKTSLHHIVLSILPLIWINKFIDYILMFFNNSNTDFVYELCNPNLKFKPLRKNIYMELIEVSFMGKSFMAFKKYDEFLRSRFENIDELPSEDRRKPSHNISICKL